MTEREPVSVTNLDGYGNPEMPWSRPRDLLATPHEHSEAGSMQNSYLGTIRPDGRPHSAGVGALWHDGDFYIVSGPGTRKSRNLAENPNCTLSTQVPGLDLIFEGTATRVTDPETLETLAARFRNQGWPAEVADDAFTAPYSAPAAGPPPWYLYRLTYHTVFGTAAKEPYGATRWAFDR